MFKVIRKSFFLFCSQISFFILFFPLLLFAQLPAIDIDEKTQNNIMQGRIVACDFAEGFATHSVKLIENNNQIPAYSLYQNYWDTLYLRSQKIEIPFYDEQIKFLLIQEGNTPFAFPISSTVSVGFVKNKGKQHVGVDFSVQKREPVVASFDGVIRISKKYEEYGNTVVIRHYNGLETVYALLNQVNVISGQKVNAGDLIGYVGSVDGKKHTFHYETRFFNEIFNPEKMINFSERKLQNNMLVLTPKDFIIAPIATHKLIINQEDIKPEKEISDAPTQDIQNISPEFHIVKQGETIFRICTNYNITPEQLKSWNKIKGDKIEVGQKLRIR